MNATNNLLTFPRGFLSSIPKWPPKTACAGKCGGGNPTPDTATFTGADGKAKHVGGAKDNGSLQITGRFTAPSALRLDRAELIVRELLDELGGAGELSKKPGGGALLPITLFAHAGSKAKDAHFQTAPGVRPSVSVEVKAHGPHNQMEFSITVDHDSMPKGPNGCAGKPSRANLRTSFTIDDGAARPLTVSATVPWQCHGHDLQVR